MRPSSPKLPRQGYTPAGTDSTRTWNLRRLFLQALLNAEDAREVVRSYANMKPMAEAAAAAWDRAAEVCPPRSLLFTLLPEADRDKFFGSAMRPWMLKYSAVAQVDQASDAFDDHTSLAPTLAELSEPEREKLRTFRDALQRWMQEYGLTSGWLSELAVSDLCGPWKGLQDALRLDVYVIGRLKSPRNFTFQTRGYDGSDTPAEYARHARQLLDQAVRRHLDSTIRRLRHRQGAEPIGFIDSRTRANVRLAAMWQVSDCSWSDFLERHGLVEARRKHEQTADALRTLLREIGLEPRAGLGAQH